MSLSSVLIFFRSCLEAEEVCEAEEVRVVDLRHRLPDPLLLLAALPGAAHLARHPPTQRRRRLRAPQEQQVPFGPLGGTSVQRVVVPCSRRRNAHSHWGNSNYLCRKSSEFQNKSPKSTFNAINLLDHFCKCTVQCPCSGWPTGYGKKLSSSQAQLSQATCLAVA